MGDIRFTIGTTPNPNSIRIGLTQPIFAKPTTYANAQAAAADPLMRKIFALPGIVQVFAMADFLSINKDAATDWSVLEPKIAQILQEHFA